jgi:hypothetical protein
LSIIADGAPVDFARRYLRGFSTVAWAGTLMTAMARFAAVVMTPVFTRRHSSQQHL